MATKELRLIDWKKLDQVLADTDPVELAGRVIRIIGLTIESQGPLCKVGDLCKIQVHNGSQDILAQVVGFRDGRVILMSLGDLWGIEPGCRVIATGKPLLVPVGRSMIGRVVNGFGQPIDGLGPIQASDYYNAEGFPPEPLKRSPIKEALPVGVKAIDALLTCGKGQRVGIFSGSGVGKSTLLGMIARNTEADVNVIGLIGERGREVKDFLERNLGAEGLKRSVVVVATSDRPALERIKAAYVATTIAEYFRDEGLDVLLIMDSLTRFAMALREVGLAVGEPPTARGYTPSVFAALPRLLERAGALETGTVTGFYSVLVEGDDVNEPISDAVRSILDGHIVLSRSLASKGHYPPIDVLMSVSRLMIDVVDTAQFEAASRARQILSTYREAEDLINIGAYVPGSNPHIDEALKYYDEIMRFTRQGIWEKSTFEESVKLLKRSVGHSC